MDSVLHQQQIDKILEALLTLAKGDYSIQIELSNENNDLDAIALGINMMGENVAKKHTQIELLNEELLKLNNQKDKFFSIIAHDLKSPFNSILGFSDILCEQVAEKNYQGIVEYSNIILQSSKRAMDLLQNLMEWSLAKTGRMAFNPEYFEMAELINEVILLLSDIAKRKSITIRKKLLPVSIVYADKNMISTVLRNLISNAIKFTYPNGEIIISSEVQHDELWISVSDNGVGMTKDTIEKLFRIDENYTTLGTQKEKGTGLGVILCKEFVEIHRGKMSVDSKIGEGSVFRFTIPYKS